MKYNVNIIGGYSLNVIPNTINTCSNTLDGSALAGCVNNTFYKIFKKKKRSHVSAQ
jgi:hypothetical protein